MSLPAKNIDWSFARNAFVEREQRPTYDELAVEVGCAPGSIARLSSEQGWPAQRAAYMDSQLEKADASAVLLRAVKADRTIITGYASFAVVTISRLTAIVEGVDDKKASATQAEAINTCTFAAKNLADSLKSLGIIGIAKTLDVEGKENNGRWNPGVLSQINLTVQNLVSQAPKDLPVDPAKVLASVPVKVETSDPTP